MDTLMSQQKPAKTRYGVLNFERRKYPRFSVDLPVEYAWVESSVGTAGRPLDVSESGLLIYFPERMEIGQCLNVKLFLNMGSNLITLEVFSEVAWTEICFEPGRGEYRTGVKFIDISSTDMAKLKQFMLFLSQTSHTK